MCSQHFFTTFLSQHLFTACFTTFFHNIFSHPHMFSQYFSQHLFTSLFHNIFSHPRTRKARLGPARPGSARLGSARLGRARLGWARLGPARPGSARAGSARLGFALPLTPPGAKNVSKWLPASPLLQPLAIAPCYSPLPQLLATAPCYTPLLQPTHFFTIFVHNHTFFTTFSTTTIFRPGPARLGSTRLGSARLGSARLGSRLHGHVPQRPHTFTTLKMFTHPGVVE